MANQKLQSANSPEKKPEDTVILTCPKCSGRGKLTYWEEVQVYGEDECFERPPAVAKTIECGYVWVF